MSTDAFGYLIVAIAIGISFIGARSPYPLLKYAASVMWMAVLAWILASPPAGIAGTGVHTILVLALVVLIVTFPLLQLWRDTRTTRNSSGGFQITEEISRFRIPRLFQGDGGESEEIGESRRAREARVEAYRQRIHNALNQDPKKR